MKTSTLSVDERRKAISSSWSFEERAKRRAFSAARQTQLERLILLTPDQVRREEKDAVSQYAASDVAIAG